MYVFIDGNKYAPLGSPTETNYHMAFDGSEIWVVTSGQKVKALTFLGKYPDVVYQQTEIDLSPYFTGSPNEEARYVVYGNGVVYVFGAIAATSPHLGYFVLSFVEIDKTTKTVTRHITLPYQAHCIPEYGHFKMWFVTPAPEDDDSPDKNKLYYYDTTGGSPASFSSLINIPGNKQFTPRKLLWGKDSWLIVSSLNENCVYKLNTSTDAFTTQVIINRKPLALYANGDRELIVGSKNAMVSVVNQTTDVSTNSYSTLNETECLIDDGDYLWCVTPNLIRIDKNPIGSPADNLRIMDGDTKDYCFDAFTDTDFLQALVTPEYTHPIYVGGSPAFEDFTEPQRLVLLAEDNVYIAYNLNDSWDLYETRDYYHKVKATAMIATGPEKYYGETT